MHHTIEARLSLRPEGGTMRNNVIRHGDLLDLLKQIPSLLTMPRRCHHHPYHNIRSRSRRLIRGMTPVHRQWQSSVLTSASFSNDATLPVLKIPACGENMRFIAEDLGHVAALTLPVCLVPVSRTFPTLDAIVFTWTISSRFI